MTDKLDEWLSGKRKQMKPAECDLKERDLERQGSYCVYCCYGALLGEKGRGLEAEREFVFLRVEQKLREEAIVDEELACYFAIIVTAARELEGQALS